MLIQNKQRTIFVLILFGMFLAVTASEADATYAPPTHVTVEMYRLTSVSEDPLDAGNIYLPAQLCDRETSVGKEYGCTVFVNNNSYRYPYGGNPVSVRVETDYLLDVVSQEMGSIEFHPFAQRAQAIAARTYAYHRQHFDSITQPPATIMNNSTQSQAFIPFRWEKWGAQSNFAPSSSNPCGFVTSNYLPEQTAICVAVDQGPEYYMTGLNHIIDTPETPINRRDAPAFTKYFKDVKDIAPTATLNEPSVVPGTTPPKFVYPYLTGVTDPVSLNPAIGTQGHRHGMSQNGASRWAYGNESWRGNLDKWSVSWNSAERILVHYFSGVQVRKPNGVSITPDDRWNMLDIDWGTSDRQPPQLQHGSSYPTVIKLQNTGLENWGCNFPSENYRLKYRWTKDSNQSNGVGQVSVCGTEYGEQTQPLNLTIQNIPNWGAGTYGLHFDVESINGQERLWSTYTVLVCVGSQSCGGIFVPDISRD